MVSTIKFYHRFILHILMFENCACLPKSALRLFALREVAKAYIPYFFSMKNVAINYVYFFYHLFGLWKFIQ